MLVDFVRRSIVELSPEPLLYLQVELVREVLSLQGRIQDIRRDESPDVETLEVCQALIYATRQIADGIAWRVLKCDRTLVHELADANQTGFIERSSIEREMAAAAKHIENLDAQVILNDLTNYLRYGDLTVVTASGIFLDEVKGGTGSKKSGRASHQKKRLNAKIEFLNERERTTERGVERLVIVGRRPVSYLDSLKTLITDATRTGSASARLSNALAIDVFDSDIMSERGLPKSGDTRNPFRQNKWAQTYSNTDHFGVFSPNQAPYSIFPLSPEQRVDLMTGRILILTYVNVPELIRTIRRRDLNARLPTQAEMDALPKNLMPDEVREHELSAAIWIGNKTHSMAVSLAHIGRLGCELLDENSLVDLFEEELEQAGTVAETGYAAFRHEALLWD
jgi:hypothetical protein